MTSEALSMCGSHMDTRGFPNCINGGAIGFPSGLRANAYSYIIPPLLSVDQCCEVSASARVHVTVQPSMRLCIAFVIGSVGQVSVSRNTLANFDSSVHHTNLITHSLLCAKFKTTLYAVFHREGNAMVIPYGFCADWNCKQLYKMCALRHDFLPINRSHISADQKQK